MNIENIFKIYGDDNFMVNIYVYATDCMVGISKEKYDYVKIKMKEYKVNECEKKVYVHKYLIQEVVNDKKITFRKNIINAIFDKYLYEIYNIINVDDVKFPNLNKYDLEINMFEIVYKLNNICVHLVKESEFTYYCYLKIITGDDKEKDIIKDFIYIKNILKF